MDQEHEEHLGQLLESVLIQMDAKYRKGQDEHGGNLWQKNPLGLHKESINEAIDQFVYMETTYTQWKDFLELVVKHPIKAREQAKKWLEEKYGDL